MAPEIIYGTKYDTKAEIFSIEEIFFYEFLVSKKLRQSLL
jgi:hypothetical protein